ncbi:hypothetical protein FRC00_003741 [Tulasnella sp. 408]|nr:hypothetical protein FRC00_003741 [Tulasnella sp. 408]
MALTSLSTSPSRPSLKLGPRRSRLTSQDRRLYDPVHPTRNQLSLFRTPNLVSLVTSKFELLEEDALTPEELLSVGQLQGSFDLPFHSLPAWVDDPDAKTSSTPSPSLAARPAPTSARQHHSEGWWTSNPASFDDDTNESSAISIEPATPLNPSSNVVVHANTDCSETTMLASFGKSSIAFPTVPHPPADDESPDKLGPDIFASKIAVLPKRSREMALKGRNLVDVNSRAPLPHISIHEEHADFSLSHSPSPNSVAPASFSSPYSTSTSQTAAASPRSTQIALQSHFAWETFGYPRGFMGDGAAPLTPPDIAIDRKFLNPSFSSFDSPHSGASTAALFTNLTATLPTPICEGNPAIRSRPPSRTCIQLILQSITEDFDGLDVGNEFATFVQLVAGPKQRI